MPQPGMCWRHAVISTHNSWLPGDPRGFRSKEHQIHSSGDYKNPPPPGEHARLHQWNQDRGGVAVVIPEDLREVAGRAILAQLKSLEYQILALAVAGTHAHGLIELPDDVPQIKRVLGKCKRKSSHAIRERLPGRVWGFGGSWKRVETPNYQRAVFEYILRQENAWVWSFRDKAS
ncbi:MAG: hypothetical protein WCL32_25235 [Planctomycetota bacterium]